MAVTSDILELIALNTLVKHLELGNVHRILMPGASSEGKAILLYTYCPRFEGLMKARMIGNS
ncbi:hypothetical protein M433DRAFT_9284 [Acidomyces richmondensis BFW]|nr:hypothetical protein M433DRAFT_9284 [Acidomyces richmondensis BFW]